MNYAEASKKDFRIFYIEPHKNNTYKGKKRFLNYF